MSCSPAAFSVQFRRRITPRGFHLCGFSLPNCFRDNFPPGVPRIEGPIWHGDHYSRYQLDVWYHHYHLKLRKKSLQLYEFYFRGGDVKFLESIFLWTLTLLCHFLYNIWSNLENNVAIDSLFCQKWRLFIFHLLIIKLWWKILCQFCRSNYCLLCNIAFYSLSLWCHIDFMNADP
jgi:hypothetical protein